MSVLTLGFGRMVVCILDSCYFIDTELRSPPALYNIKSMDLTHLPVSAGVFISFNVTDLCPGQMTSAYVFSHGGCATVSLEREPYYEKHPLLVA